MASYGRNFDFRVPPRAQARYGRYASPVALLTGSGPGGGTAAGSASGAGLIPIGAAVVPDNSAGIESGRSLQYVKLATQAQAPVAGCGILVYEYGPAAYAGYDPFTTTYSDLDAAPQNAAVQVIQGDPTTKVVFTNTVAGLFLGVRRYPGRTMVTGTFTSSPLTVGDYLVPGQGDDVEGYWEAQGSATNAWLQITGIDTTRLEVEARMLF